MRLIILTGVLSFGLLNTTAQTTVVINGERSYDIEKVPKIELPKTIQVNHKGRSKISLKLVSAGRQLWSTQLRSGELRRILETRRATDMVITIETKGSKMIHLIKLE